MKYVILLVFIILVFMTSTCAKTEEDKRKIKINKKTALIDVRTKTEFDRGHLENSINIPYTEIVEKISTTTKNKDAYIVVYCRSGRRSGIAKKMLNNIGYKNVVNGGSYTDLKHQIPKPIPEK